MEEVLADSGYSSGSSLRYLEKAGIQAYIPCIGNYLPFRKDFSYNALGDFYQCKAGVKIPFSGIFAILGAIGATTYFVFSVLMIVSVWRLFEKAGKPGWAAIIPIYNFIVAIEIVGKPTIWILWLLIPCVNIIFGIWLMNLFVKSFGKSEAYTIGMFILPFIFYPLLAFGNNPYLGPSAAEAKRSGPYNGYGSNNPFNQPPTPPEV